MRSPRAAWRRAWAPLVLLALLGVTALALLPPAAHAPATVDEAQAAWARVLARHVDARGRIDFDGLATASADLEAYVDWLGVHGPRSLPAAYTSPAAVLAYHLNAYNALAMRTVLRAGPRGTLDAWRRIKVFVLTPQRVDGGWTTLYFYENHVIRPLGEPRVHFALNCMVRDCPRLPYAPFDAATLDAALTTAAREFVDDPRKLTLAPNRRVLRLSSIFAFYTEDFLVRDASLVAYLNRLRDPREAIPADYAVEFMPYDWTVNRQNLD